MVPRGLSNRPKSLSSHLHRQAQRKPAATQCQIETIGCFRPQFGNPFSFDSVGVKKSFGRGDYFD
jgi:hypothetical protein